MHLTKTHYSCDLKLFRDFIGDHVVSQRPNNRNPCLDYVFENAIIEHLNGRQFPAIGDFEDNNVCRAWLSIFQLLLKLVLYSPDNLTLANSHAPLNLHACSGRNSLLFIKM